MQEEDDVVGIALSGGGARAMAFHLGCLRALHSIGLLQRCKVVSSVSGGSVIAAMFITHKGGFDEFEQDVRRALTRGFFKPSLRYGLPSLEAVLAVASFFLLCSVTVINIVTLSIQTIVNRIISFFTTSEKKIDLRVRTRRFASRTTILEKTFDALLFKGKKFSDLCEKRPIWVAIATELRTGSAFYFGSKETGCWRFGKIRSEDIAISKAVTASAAYPAFLPAYDDVYNFNKKDGSRRKERISLTDGGVYDNLGLAPFWPDRDRSVGLDLPSPNIVIACRAGYGLRFDEPTGLAFSRLKACFYTVLGRAENAAMKRLFDLKETGAIKAFAIPYLGQDDSRLKCKPTDLVSRDSTDGYPTDFNAMPDEWIEKLSKRGEQVTLAVIKEHNPELLVSLRENEV
ncbi:patatin-like phospholipase family protein [Polycladidibacter hongkongensis]|uniref:patatin-like phospholipase family protein n=1 Tax=Polycladidibacter hongkongensis TaxID=1647556 RepID=UPI00082ADE8D|nr:patatin-like phospholipase family protein [Pseudovibrio hongkongensis]